MCDDQWGAENAAAVCKQLGFASATRRRWSSSRRASRTRPRAASAAVRRIPVSRHLRHAAAPRVARRCLVPRRAADAARRLSVERWGRHTASVQKTSR